MSKKRKSEIAVTSLTEVSNKKRMHRTEHNPYYSSKKLF